MTLVLQGSIPPELLHGLHQEMLAIRDRVRSIACFEIEFKVANTAYVEDLQFLKSHFSSDYI